MAFGGAFGVFAAFAAFAAAFAAVLIAVLEPLAAFGVFAVVAAFAGSAVMCWKMLKFMEYLEANAALWSEKLAYMEHRMDASAGSVYDRVRHVANVVMQYDEALSASKGLKKMDFWVVRRLQVEFEATCRMCSSPAFKDQKLTWRMVQTEVLWRLQRDICGCRWVAVCSNDEDEKKLAAEDLVVKMKGLENAKLFAKMQSNWEPMHPEDCRNLEVLCWEQYALQRQILERFEEVQWYLQGHEDFAEGLIDVEGLGGVCAGCSDKKVGGKL